MWQHLDDKSAVDIVDLFGLQPLEVEGGFWAPMSRTAEMNSILYLMTPGGFSALHRLTVTEGWQWLAGGAAQMLRLYPDALPETTLLNAQNSQTIVSAGTWQGAKTLGEWTLISCWCAPAFTDDCFTLGNASNLVKEYPVAKVDIEELCR